MKSLRTIRLVPAAAEPARDSVPVNRSSRALASASNPAGNARREYPSSLPGPSAGWRLPSGQLLVEYALQTCFTGSPFGRSPFQPGQEGESEPALSASVLRGAAEPVAPSPGLERLHAAVGGEDSGSAEPSPRRTTAPRNSTSKERSRS